MDNTFLIDDELDADVPDLDLQTEPDVSAPPRHCVAILPSELPSPVEQPHRG